jgi:hypothetical protein
MLSYRSPALQRQSGQYWRVTRSARTGIRLSVAIATAMMFFAASCSSGQHRSAPPASTSPSTVQPPTRQATFRGVALLDGHRFDAAFIGSVVVEHGLVTPCNVTIPAINGGQFTIDVYSADASVGCGRSAAKVVFWTYVNNRQLFATSAVEWASGGASNLTIPFSPSRPLGAAFSVLELSGGAYTADGNLVNAGARVDAYIGDTLCGVASVRHGEFNGYILHVVGPDSRPGCQPDGLITFRIDGSRVSNTIRRNAVAPRQLDLTES